MDTLFIVEYKAFCQPIHETNILGIEPFSKKDDLSGVIITMIKKDTFLNLIIENPNKGNFISGNIEIPFPSDNGVKSNMIKINDIIELVLSKAQITTLKPISKNSASASANVDGNDFITVPKKTFADRVRGDFGKSESKFISHSSVSANINPKLNSDIRKIIRTGRESINKERCFKYNGKSNCLIVASHQNSENMDCCKQCKNMLVTGAKQLDITSYKCNNCKNIVFINDNGLPNDECCNVCLNKQRLK